MSAIRIYTRLRTRAIVGLLLVAFTVGLWAAPVVQAEPAVRVNVGISGQLEPGVARELSRFANDVHYAFQDIAVMTMTVPLHKIDQLRAHPAVEWVEPDTERWLLTDFTMANGAVLSWDHDMIDVEEVQEEVDGSGVTVAVLDTGLVSNWRDYFPEDHIDTGHAIAFYANDGFGSARVPMNITGYGSNEKWDNDIIGHGTHVSSTILGFNMAGIRTVTGVAPGVTILPVKVIHNGAFGWDSMIMAGIYYVVQLKEAGEIGPTVISMSIGGSFPSQAEIAAINFAISKGVLTVAAAGNEGTDGMSWPGAYPQVISAGASGWTQQWLDPETGQPVSFAWWREGDVPEKLKTRDPLGNRLQVFVADFSSRENPSLVELRRQQLGPWVPDQDLDVVAPGEWVVGPFPSPNFRSPVMGEFFFASGTSMATPHVSGIVALMLQQRPDLTQAEAEVILEGTAFSIGKPGINPGSALVFDIFELSLVTISWEKDGLEATGSGLVQADAALKALH